MVSAFTLPSLLHRRPPRVISGEPDWSRAAVAALFRPSSDGLDLLFIRRALDPRDPWSGQIGFPGGRAEPEDRDLEHTAIRETLEEIGLDLRVQDVRALGALDELQARARTRIPPLTIRPHAFLLPPEHPAIYVPSDEVAEVFWAPVTELLNPAHHIWYEGERASLPMRFPAVTLGPSRTLWGLTHRMVGEILERLDLIDDADRFSTPKPPA